MRLKEKLHLSYKQPVQEPIPVPMEDANSRSASVKLTKKNFEQDTSTGKDFFKLIRSSGSAGQNIREIASFLILIGKGEAAKVLSLLPVDIVEKITMEITQIETISPKEREKILNRFKLSIQANTNSVQGGMAYARDLLEKSLGSDKAKKILDRVPYNHLEFLNELDSIQLFQLVEMESPRLIGIILLYIDPRRAAKLLKNFSDTTKSKIIKTMQEKHQLSRETIQSIAEALKKKILEQGKPENKSINGPQTLAEILRNMDQGSERQILSELHTISPNLEEKITDHLFTMERIFDISDKDLQKLLASIDDDEIAMLLKGKSKKIRTRLLACLSDKRSEAVNESDSLLSAQPKTKVEEITRKFCNTLREMDKMGTISIVRNTDKYID